MLIYFLIFFSKIIENTLSTLRIILVSNGKKKLGAILQGIVALVWIFVTGVVIIDIGKDFFKVLFFCLGTIIGSYLGSILEEKIAIGNNTLLCITKNKCIKKLENKLNKKVHKVIKLNSNYYIILISIKRKEFKNITHIIKNIDENSIIISEKKEDIV